MGVVWGSHALGGPSRVVTWNFYLVANMDVTVTIISKLGGFNPFRGLVSTNLQGLIVGITVELIT